MATLRILISGGGIAGNALAFWLNKLRHEVTVVKRFASLRTTGLQVDLRGHGIEVLRYMGLEEKFRAKSVREEGLEIVDSKGKRQAYFPANRSGKGLQIFSTDFEILRGDLCQLLHDAAMNDGNKVKYVFGTSVEKFEEKDEGVEVFFANGQGSSIRRMMLGKSDNEEDGFRPLNGRYIGYFTMPKSIQDGEGCHRRRLELP